MGNINRVVVEGNLTQSAELSRWTDGTPYSRFTIAYNDSYKNRDTGEWQSIPSFFDCMCKGNYAEAMSKHLLKGRRISVEGKLKQQTWTDDQGIRHSKVIIRSDRRKKHSSRQTIRARLRIMMLQCSTIQYRKIFRFRR